MNKIFPEFQSWQHNGMLMFMSVVRKECDGKHYTMMISKSFEVDNPSYEKIMECTQNFLLEAYKMYLFKEVPVLVPIESKPKNGFSIRWQLDHNQETEQERINKI